MSKATDSYEALKDRIETVLPTHNRLIQPYKPEENPEDRIKKGYGIQIGPGENTNRNISCKISIKRDMIVVLTRKWFAKELDRDAKEVTEKALLEDQFLVIADFEADPTLGASGTVVNSAYVSDSGVDFIFTNKDNFIKLETTFSLEYLEDLN